MVPDWFRIAPVAVYDAFMAQEQADQYLNPYRKAVDQFGPGFEATLWNSRKSQQKRFDVMIELVDFTEKVVVDAGCGTGDFAAHLFDQGISYLRYVGIDAVENLINAAKKRNLPRCEFIHADLVHDHSSLNTGLPDYVCISGTLNTMSDETARALVRDAFNAAKRGVVFNFLSNRLDESRIKFDLGPARRFNTVEWLDWSLTVTPCVRFAQDYFNGHDATIVMRHC